MRKYIGRGLLHVSDREMEGGRRYWLDVRRNMLWENELIELTQYRFPSLTLVVSVVSLRISLPGSLQV
jgi:hypothetical protein